MKWRSALWILPAVVAAGLALLVDPFGWLARREPAQAAAPDASGEVSPDDAGDSTVAAIAPQGAAAPIPSTDRHAVDAVSADRQAVFRLLDAEGRSVSGATVLVARGEALLHFGASDAEGAVSLAADGEAAQLVAWATDRPLELWPVRLELGLHELRYPESARVAGRLEREDGAPAAGLHLSLQSEKPLLPELPIPEVVWSQLGRRPEQAVLLSSESGADGGFAFAGLPADWRGALRVPRGWRIRSASGGRTDADPRRLLLESPSEALLLRLAAPALLRGRLLRRSDAVPLARVPLSARLRDAENGSGHDLGLATDDTGRFELTLGVDRIAGLELRLGDDPRQASLLLELEEAALPPDGELGDVFVDGVRDVPFLLCSAHGEPIRGGRALAAGMKSQLTGADGRGVLRWVPVATTRLRAEAEGFVPVEAELVAVLPDPLRIALEPACSLEVRLIPPEGGDTESFRVVLLRKDGVTAGPCRDATDQQAYVGRAAFAPADLMQAPAATFLAAQSSGPEGVFDFRALRVGVPIELEVRGITGLVAYQRRSLAPFQAGEKRSLEISLAEIGVFRGRLLDAEGNPLARATVQLDGQILGWTEEDGTFLCFPADPSPGTLVLQHPSCATRFLHDYVVPPGGREVEFRLQPARNVTIEVVDAAGRPVPQAEVWILQEGFTTNTHRAGAGRHVASSLTDQPFQIEVRLGGRRYLREHSSERPEAVVVVPVHGSVVARVGESTTRGRAGHLSLILQAETADVAMDALSAGKRCRSGELAIDLPAVLPGRYKAWLTYEPSDEERAAGAADASSAVVTVSVEADRRAEIRLDLP